MRKKTLLLVILLMSLSLVGLIGFQAYWIQHAVQMEEEVFDRNVNDALHQVVRRLETNEAVLFLKEEAPQLRAAALTTVAEPVTVLPDPAETPAPTPLPTPKPVKSSVAKIETVAPVQEQVLFVPSKKVEPLRAAETIVLRRNAPFEIITSRPVTHSTATTIVSDKSAKGRVYARSSRPDTSRSTASKNIFGHSKLDSVVIWKVLAANTKMVDTIKVAGLYRQKRDSNMVLKYSFDTLQLVQGVDFMQHLPVKNISSIDVRKSNNGNYINIYTDSILKQLPRQAFQYEIDTLRRNMLRVAAPISTRAIVKSLNKENEPTPVKAPSPKPQVYAAAKKLVAQEQTNRQKAAAKAQHLNQVMEKMAAEYVRKEKPLKQRLDELELEKLLATELKNRDICTPYELQIETGEEDNFVFANNRPELPSAAGVYQVRLFPNDVLTSPSYLRLNFPERHTAVWQSILAPTLISYLFTFIIILTFYFTLSTILRQKKISEIKNDFINNMTHEFKTPIATISLALDALVNPKVRTDEARVDYYARIIKDENRRMHHQVEKVLQTAQMERNRIQLAFEQVDVHQLIKKATEPFQLHIEQRKGVLDLKLDASTPTVWADPGHLANMIANLLDNAIKYSPNTPNIVVQTSMISNGMHISVEDQGAGMSREAQKKVFEKFYRVPTGNVHNVKGFGLGLSYVKTMAEAHSGSIHVRSELGRGSKFTLWLPSQNPQS
ncbi:sensor histidine kinase [Rufibacter roseus]|uniref:histidine kinase n=1 Tax=Rufibacter roseus TaxID=1567108 RepID=A0ABW2DSX6_9BACT|nr:HAMP domain-containing sensor histidine kinase [Rufibacter roseus]